MMGIEWLVLLELGFVQRIILARRLCLVLWYVGEMGMGHA